MCRFARVCTKVNACGAAEARQSDPALVMSAGRPIMESGGPRNCAYLTGRRAAPRRAPSLEPYVSLMKYSLCGSNSTCRSPKRDSETRIHAGAR
ncbi:hypothetical protein ALC57_08315 [Trachymyrmex cornetzi]|uniref:Uncharacterized protein n=1 Tax=Trachymyrmex cornetzi TaxID=471704 RepID=A0A151J707_9HYME|nr:hypothetical protein ALC57_08315 [Trachymyrmex cornetzi]